MYALLAICITLIPTRLDENVHSTLREKQGENMARVGSLYATISYVVLHP